MKEIILATNNRHKVIEFEHIFENKVKLFSLKDIGFTGEIIEDRDTFIDNAIIKCKALYNVFKKPVLADDSGLTVAALNGAPGVLSARYGGEGLDDKERYTLLINNLKGYSDLSASFVCALVLYINPNRIHIIQEEFKGLITLTPRGENGFGYDPVFYLKAFDKTLAELPAEEKNKISHRARSADLMKKIIFSMDDNWEVLS